MVFVSHFCVLDNTKGRKRNRIMPKKMIIGWFLWPTLNWPNKSLYTKHERGLILLLSQNFSSFALVIRFSFIALKIDEVPCTLGIMMRIQKKINKYCLPILYFSAPKMLWYRNSNVNRMLRKGYDIIIDNQDKPFHRYSELFEMLHVKLTGVFKIHFFPCHLIRTFNDIAMAQLLPQVMSVSTMC